MTLFRTELLAHGYYAIGLHHCPHAIKSQAVIAIVKTGIINVYLSENLTIGSKLESPSLKQKALHPVQTAKDQVSSPVADESEIKLTNNVSEIGEVFRKELEVLLSNHSVSVQQLKHDVAQMNRSLTSQMKEVSNQIEKVGQQLEGVQSLFSCLGEPPSPRNGRPAYFERKHGSGVSYECQKYFVLAGNSTVRCHFGKWEGQPPLCTPQALFGATFTLRAHMDEENRVSNVSCSTEENHQKIDFSWALDTGRAGGLPSGSRTYSRDRASILDLADVEDKRGVFECTYDRDGKHAGITFVIAFGQFSRPVVASIGDTVQLGERIVDPDLKWMHDGEHVPAWDGRVPKIAGVRRQDAGTYGVYSEKDRRFRIVMTRLVVRGCPDNLFGERCDQNCTPCYNGGVCHDLHGTCVCPSGFKGEHCEVACGENRVGPNCSESCEGGDCFRQIFCRPDPYGCSCAPGYWGLYCNFKCDRGKFGADCLQTCRCKEGSCDPYTGACSGGCSPGWSGPSCQIPDGA